MKNKTISVWLTLFAGPLGLHRLYLTGKFDSFSWMLLLPTLAGAYGVLRAREIGLDDHLSWILIPWVGFSASVAALNAIYYGLMDGEKWNHRFNPDLPATHVAGRTSWLTVGGLVAALLLGATVLLSSIAFTFQRYFEYQSDHAAQAVIVDVRKAAG